MTSLFLRFSYILNFVALAFIAYFLAKGTGNLMAREIGHHLPRPKSRPTSDLKSPPKLDFHKKVVGDAILARNIFDSTRGPISRFEQETVPPDPDPDEQQKTLVPCIENDLRLEATVSIPDAPQYSLASVSYQGDSSIYKVGDNLADGAVTLISWQYLILAKDDSYCYLDLFKKRTKPLNRKQLRKGIRSKGRGRRVVDKKVLESILTNPGALMKGFSARPYRKGRTEGYKIRRLGRSHPLYTIGIRQNDIVTKVNGKSIGNFQESLTALNQLKKKGSVDVEYFRRGQRKELNLEIK